jgi:hypothetical protein
MDLGDLKEVVLCDGYDYARIIMKTEWRWTPQRIKQAVVVCREIDLSRIQALDMAYLYIAEYPEDFDKIHNLLSQSKFILGNPWKGSTIDPAFFTD